PLTPRWPDAGRPSPGGAKTPPRRPPPGRNHPPRGRPPPADPRPSGRERRLSDRDLPAIAADPGLTTFRLRFRAASRVYRDKSLQIRTNDLQRARDLLDSGEL